MPVLPPIGEMGPPEGAAFHLRYAALLGVLTGDQKIIYEWVRKRYPHLIISSPSIATGFWHAGSSRMDFVHPNPAVLISAWRDMTRDGKGGDDTWNGGAGIGMMSKGADAHIHLDIPSADEQAGRYGPKGTKQFYFIETGKNLL